MTTSVTSPLDRRRHLTGMAFVTPTLLVITAILVYPILQSIVLSFGTSSLDGSEPYQFVGLKHYAALAQTERFWNALGVTLTFTALSIPLELIMGIGLAVLLNESFRGKGIARLAVLFPWALPTALNTLMWRWMYNTDYGLFNAVALQSGVVDRPINWLGDETLAMLSMVVVAVWKTSSFMALIILAGLQSIPRELYEAGRMDGMTRWQEFREITLPLLKGPILVALIIRSMDALRTFELPFNLTDGGPVTATESLSLYAYKVMFDFIEFNFGAAIVVVQFLVIFAMSLIYILTLRNKD
ncbi:carbohydrate ABC transporter membrane protein 1 (CUT1 family) [Aliiruegeria haliotis]|uniref:Carbohydrate ABC transporter membrane protein 1 (CUT1 family) n=1 Tax=Aliiruegeria haliotis TaxID=1280846 RepID=A0A2T0RFL2_9RHOB|nr:sugar ABC transporter permease [Aliiruegeria haliotis]PRY19945.1 carbohydrate ABC transporter membrane protein 1 (CUT1 family) [Aliiruegeria haliotis]